LKFIVGPYYIFLIRPFLRQGVAELIEAVWKVLTFVNENVVVEWLDFGRSISGNLEQYSLSAISALAERAVAALVPR
jgi:hypothetical protein